MNLWTVWRVSSAVGLDGAPLWLALVGAGVLGACMPMTRAAIVRDRPVVRRTLYWIGGFHVAWVMWGMIGVALVDLVRLASLATGGWLGSCDTIALGLGVPICVGAMTAYGFWRARRIPRPHRIELRVDGLDEALDGLTIAQLSDIHVGPAYGARMVASLVERVNRERPDVVVLTGDIADGDIGDFMRGAHPLARIEARLGAYAVLGNHDHHAGATRVEEALREAGIDVLRNQWREVTLGLAVAGLDERLGGFVRPDGDPAAQVTASIGEGMTVLLLAHRPGVFDTPGAERAALTLAGHTHGGQLWPWAAMVRRQCGYVSGCYRVGSRWLYVSRGIGTWGPPVRLGACPEVPVHVLRRTEGSRPIV